MTRPGFFEGLLVALIASILASSMFTGVSWLFGTTGTLELMISVISMAYLCYLLFRCQEKAGRIVVFILGSVITFGLYLLPVPLLLLILCHIAMCWLVRSLYFYSSVLSALIDLGLQGLSLLAAVWAGMHSNSLFLGVWCFFLLQALFIFIPPRICRSARSQQNIRTKGDQFEQAHRHAEAALRRLSSAC